MLGNLEPDEDVMNDELIAKRKSAAVMKELVWAFTTNEPVCELVTNEPVCPSKDPEIPSAVKLRIKVVMTMKLMEQELSGHQSKAPVSITRMLSLLSKT